MYQSSGFKALERAPATEFGLSEIALDSFFEALGKLPARMRGVIVLVGGKVVAERYWPPYQPADKVWVYSISKSFLATAAGFAIGEGKLALGDRVASFFPEHCPAAISGNLAKMSLRDLLSMSSGHREDTLGALVHSSGQDWVKTFLALPVEHAPGSYFCYNSGASFMAAAILEKATGQKLVEYLTPRLFEPLGFDSVEWDESPAGVAAGGWGIVLRLEDLAKLGQLYLDKGMYGGERVLSADWVALASAKQADNSQNPDNQSPDWTAGYGFQFWRCQNGAFRADGAAGQYCIVMPEQNAVVAIMSESLEMQPTLDAVWDHLLPAVGRLASPIESQIDGKCYALAQNPLGLTKAVFRFQEDALELALHKDDGGYALSAGRGRWRDDSGELPFGCRTLLPITSLRDTLWARSAHFEWLEDTALELNWAWRQTPHTDKLVCRFRGQELELICPQNGATLFSGAPEVCLLGTTAEPVTIPASAAQKPAAKGAARTGAGKFSRQSTVGSLLKDETAKAIIESHMPGVSRNPAVGLVKNMPIERLAKIPQTGLTLEMLDALLAEINGAAE